MLRWHPTKELLVRFEGEPADDSEPLSEELRARVSAHLEGCARCRERSQKANAAVFLAMLDDAGARLRAAGLDPQKIGEGLDSIDRMEAILAAAAPYWHPSQAEIGCYQDDLEAGGRFLHPSLRIKVKVHLGTGCEECRKIIRLRSAVTGLFFTHPDPVRAREGLKKALAVSLRGFAEQRAEGRS